MQDQVKPQQQRELAPPPSNLVHLMGIEQFREFLTHVIYDRCGLEMETYDPTVKDGGAQEGLARYLAGMAHVGRDLKHFAMAVTPSLWRRAEDERNSRIELAIAQKKQPEEQTNPSKEDSDD